MTTFSHQEHNSLLNSMISGMAGRGLVVNYPEEVSLSPAVSKSFHLSAEGLPSI
jgi:hypothetical protein